jgi:hypothetical protein
VRLSDGGMEGRPTRRRALARLVGRVNTGAESWENAPIDGVSAPGLDQGRLLSRTTTARHIEALTEPEPVPIAELRLSGDEFVIGVTDGERARAYPLPLLFRAHIVNDLMGSRALTVTFCGNCFSGVVFEPLVRGQRLTFDLIGAYLGAFTMRDDQTATLWSQLTGEALAGPMVGERLVLVESELTRLSEWASRHPASTAPDMGDVAVRAIRPRLPRADAMWWNSVGASDTRLPLDTLVLGVAAGGASRAYPVDLGRPEQLVIDQLGGVPLALLSEPGGSPLAYDRRRDGVVLELHLEEGRIVDQQGSAWSGRGVALDGPSQGSRLRFVPSQIVQWYAWAAHHRDTEIGAPIAESGRRGRPS